MKNTYAEYTKSTIGLFSKIGQIMKPQTVVKKPTADMESVKTSISSSFDFFKNAFLVAL